MQICIYIYIQNSNIIQYSHPGCSYSTTPFLYCPSDHSDFIPGFFGFAWAPPMDSPTGIFPIGTARITLNNLMLLGGVWYGVLNGGTNSTSKSVDQLNIETCVFFWGSPHNLRDPYIYMYVCISPLYPHLWYHQNPLYNYSNYRYYNSSYIEISNGNYRVPDP